MVLRALLKATARCEELKLAAEDFIEEFSLTEAFLGSWPHGLVRCFRPCTACIRTRDCCWGALSYASRSTTSLRAHASDIRSLAWRSPPALKKYRHHWARQLAGRYPQILHHSKCVVMLVHTFFKQELRENTSGRRKRLNFYDVLVWLLGGVEV